MQTEISVESKMERGEESRRLVYITQLEHEDKKEQDFPIIKTTLTTIQKWVDYITGMDEYRKHN